MTIGFSQDCDDGYTAIEGYCYYQADLDVLETFIDNSNGSINFILDTNNDGIISELELCSQAWEDGRLKSLNCSAIMIDGNYNWLGISSAIASNIENWTQIELLNISYAMRMKL